MAAASAFAHAVDLALANPSLGVGCHLTLVDAHAVASAREIPSLADPDGRLPATLAAFVARVSSGMIRRTDMERELRAQITKIKAAGISPTHLDTHKHTHAHPRVLDALGRVAQEFGIHRIRKPIESLRHSWSSRAPIRQRIAASAARIVTPIFRTLSRRYDLHSPDNFLGLASTGRLDPTALRLLIDTLPPGQTEIMLHPGICDVDLTRTGTRLERERESELHALLDPAVRRALSAQGVQLITYKDLA